MFIGNRDSQLTESSMVMNVQNSSTLWPRSLIEEMQSVKFRMIKVLEYKIMKERLACSGTPLKIEWELVQSSPCILTLTV